MTQLFRREGFGQPGSSGKRRALTVRRGPTGGLGALQIAGHVEHSRGVNARRARRIVYEGYENSFGLVYVTAGAGRYRDAARDLPLDPGSLIHVFPGRPHWYGVVEPEETWNEIFLVFDGPVFRLAAEQGLMHPARPVRRLLPVSYWQHRLDSFRVRRPPRSPGACDAEACDLLRLIVEISGQQPHRPDVEEPDSWFHRSQTILESVLGEHMSLPEVAAQVGMRYETWRRRYRARAGCAPGQYRLLRRIDAAADLLGRTSLSTREIAAMLGFSDEHHLIRHFRTVTGSTPRQYRDSAT